MILYKYRDLSRIDRVFDIIENKQLFCSAYHDLNDPFEGEYNFYYGETKCGNDLNIDTISDNNTSHFNKIVNCNYGICSLSAENNDVKMWSFYADGHKGICIEIELDDNNNDIYPVKYDLDSKKVSHEDLSEDTIKKILTRKSQNWKYEAEYRIISKIGFYNIKGKIKSIILGCRIDSNVEKIIRKLAPEISFKYARLGEGYKLQISET